MLASKQGILQISSPEQEEYMNPSVQRVESGAKNTSDLKEPSQGLEEQEGEANRQPSASADKDNAGNMAARSLEDHDFEEMQLQNQELI